MSHILCIALWKEKSTNSIQILHVGYAIGALICPLIVRPFMLPSSHEVIDTESDVTIDNIHGLIHTPDEVKVHWPFLFIGAPAVLTGIWYFFLCEKKTDKNEMKHEGEKCQGLTSKGSSSIRQYIVCSLIAISCTTSFPIWLIVG